jgi:hypothetical protein
MGMVSNMVMSGEKVMSRWQERAEPPPLGRAIWVNREGVPSSWEFRGRDVVSEQQIDSRRSLSHARRQSSVSFHSEKLQRDKRIYVLSTNFSSARSDQSLHSLQSESSLVLPS